MSQIRKTRLIFLAIQMIVIQKEQNPDFIQELNDILETVTKTLKEAEFLVEEEENLEEKIILELLQTEEIHNMISVLQVEGIYKKWILKSEYILECILEMRKMVKDLKKAILKAKDKYIPKKTMFLKAKNPEQSFMKC